MSSGAIDAGQLSSSGTGGTTTFEQRCWGSKIDFLSCFWNDEASLEPTDGVTHGMVVPAVVSEDGSVTGPVLLTVVLGFVLLRWFTSKGEVSDQM